MCKVLTVSESGYYRYKRNKENPGKDEILSAQIRQILSESVYNRNYGVPRMKLALEEKEIRVGIRRLKRVMRYMGLIHNRRKPRGLTQATTEIQEKENLIKQDFTAASPHSKMLTDISQIQCMDGKLYISPIMDCFNGEILAMRLDNNMKKELCIETFRALKQQFNIKNGVLHSDRGSQYTSDAFRNELKTAGVLQSLSGVAHCYDNSRMESFFATLKKELLYQIPVYRMKREQVKTIIFRYVFIYYNRMRIYTTNPGGMPPAKYRELFEMNELEMAA